MGASHAQAFGRTLSLMHRRLATTSHMSSFDTAQRKDQHWFQKTKMQLISERVRSVDGRSAPNDGWHTADIGCLAVASGALGLHARRRSLGARTPSLTLPRATEQALRGTGSTMWNRNSLLRWKFSGTFESLIPPYLYIRGAKASMSGFLPQLRDAMHELPAYMPRRSDSYKKHMSTCSLCTYSNGGW